MDYQTIFNNLINGETYSDGFNGITVSPNGCYLRYSYFGSSATRCTVENLEWIIETIFGLNAEQFASRFNKSNNIYHA